MENPIILEKAIEPAFVVITEARLVPFVLGVALPLPGFIFILHFVLVFAVIKLKRVY